MQYGPKCHELPSSLGELLAQIEDGNPIWKAPAQFENRIKPRMYYAKYYVRKSSILLAGTGARKISSVACGFSPIKIHFSDYPLKFNQQNK